MRRTSALREGIRRGTPVVLVQHVDYFTKLHDLMLCVLRYRRPYLAFPLASLFAALFASRSSNFCSSPRSTCLSISGQQSSRVRRDDTTHLADKVSPALALPRDRVARIAQFGALLEDGERGVTIVRREGEGGSEGLKGDDADRVLQVEEEQ